MSNVSYNQLLSAQRQFFNSGTSRSIPFRIEQLKKLKSIITTNENVIAEALKNDLNNASMEAIFSEILFLVEEINLAIRKLKKWTKKVKVPSPFPIFWPGRSEIVFEPYGCVL